MYTKINHPNVFENYNYAMHNHATLVHLALFHKSSSSSDRTNELPELAGLRNWQSWYDWGTAGTDMIEV